MQVAGVILAAGASTRFGSPKQLARIGGRTMLESVADAAHQASLHPVLAVVPSGMVMPPTVVPVLNDEPDAGMSRSLQLGIAAVPVEADAAVILLGDQPTIEASLIREVIEAASPERPIVATEAGGVLAPPVLLMRSAFDVVDLLHGDAGLRSVLDRRGESVRTVRVARHEPDVDTPADLQALGGRIAHMFDSSSDRDR